MIIKSKIILCFQNIYYISLSGAEHVFDTTFSRNFSLIESCREFIRRFQRKGDDKKALPMLASVCPGEIFTDKNFI
jgi:iron only hydrogenase large subunit-like protein